MKPLNLLWIGSWPRCLTLAPSLGCALALSLGCALALSLGCGDEGEPVPGNADPCATPMAGVLGCPADSTLTAGNALAPGGGEPLAAQQSVTVEQACGKLVTCGLLAAKYFGSRGNECTNSGDCPTGECRANKDGARFCYFHRLDYAWCVAKFLSPGSNRCDSEDRFTTDEIGSILGCIAKTPCASLGLPLTEKLANSESELDRYLCNDGETRVSTATTCDHGLLIYR